MNIAIRFYLTFFGTLIFSKLMLDIIQNNIFKAFVIAIVIAVITSKDE